MFRRPAAASIALRSASSPGLVSLLGLLGLLGSALLFDGFLRFLLFTRPFLVLCFCHSKPPGRA